MGIDFTTELLDFDGKKILGVTVKDGRAITEPATLGSVAKDALANSQLSLSMDEKLRAFKLANGIEKMSNAELAAESIALLKKCIAAAQPPLVVGRCLEIIDPASLKEGEGPVHNAD